MPKTLTADYSISNIEKNVKAHFVESLIFESLVKQLAHVISREHVTSEAYYFHTEYRLSVIVATPKEYWADVERKAMELSIYINKPPVVSYES